MRDVTQYRTNMYLLAYYSAGVINKEDSMPNETSRIERYGFG